MSGPQKIPGYQILGKLGSGAMGTVYRARQVSLSRDVAIKILPQRLAANRKFLERFYREARSSAKLNHENIVGALDVGEADGMHYFVMEYVDGATVGAELQDGPLSEKRAIAVAKQILRALDHASAAGIVHRDIKPDNIMVTRQGVAKLCDLGLAKQASTDSSVTAHGVAVGTPWYISPEQARGELKIDARTDLYALGATLFHLTTGGPPYVGPTTAVVMTKHLNDPVPDPRARNPKLSAPFAEFVTWLMQKARDDRPQSPGAALRALERVERRLAPLPRRGIAGRKDAGASGRKAGSPRGPHGATAEPPPDKPGSKMGLAIAGVVIALVGVVALVVAISSGNGDEPVRPTTTTRTEPPPLRTGRPTTPPNRPEPPRNNRPSPPAQRPPERDAIKERLVARMLAEYESAREFANRREYREAIEGYTRLLGDAEYNEFKRAYAPIARYLGLAKQAKIEVAKDAEAAAKQAIAEIKQAVADGDYENVAAPRYAEAVLAWREFPDDLEFTAAYREAVPAALERIETQARAYFGKVKSAAADKARQRRYAQALLVLKDARPRLTPKLLPALDALGETIAQKQRAYLLQIAGLRARARAEYEAFVPAVRELVEAGKYPLALARLDEALKTPKFTADLKVGGDLLRDRALVASIQWVYRAALKAVTEAAGKSVPLALTPKHQMIVASVVPRSETLEALGEPDVTVRYRLGRKEETRAFSAFSGEDLLALAFSTVRRPDLRLLADVSFSAYRQELAELSFATATRAKQLRLRDRNQRLHAWAAARIGAALEQLAPEPYAEIEKNVVSWQRRKSDRYKNRALEGIDLMLALFSETRFLMGDDGARRKKLEEYRALLTNKPVDERKLQLFQAPYKLRGNKLTVTYKFSNTAELEDFPKTYSDGGKTKIAAGELQLLPSTDSGELGQLLAGKRGPGAAKLIVARRFIGKIDGEFKLSLKAIYEQPNKEFGYVGLACFRSSGELGYRVPVQYMIDVPSYKESLPPGIYRGTGKVDLRSPPEAIGMTGTFLMSPNQRLTIVLERTKSGRFTYKLNGRAMTNGTDRTLNQGFLDITAIATRLRISELKLEATLDKEWLKAHKEALKKKKAAGD